MGLGKVWGQVPLAKSWPALHWRSSWTESGEKHHFAATILTKFSNSILQFLHCTVGYMAICNSGFAILNLRFLFCNSLAIFVFALSRVCLHFVTFDNNQHSVTRDFRHLSAIFLNNEKISSYHFLRMCHKIMCLMILNLSEMILDHAKFDRRFEFELI